jgi:hypothetical protein
MFSLTLSTVEVWVEWWGHSLLRVTSHWSHKVEFMTSGSLPWGPELNLSKSCSVYSKPVPRPAFLVLQCWCDADKRKHHTALWITENKRSFTTAFLLGVGPLGITLRVSGLIRPWQFPAVCECVCVWVSVWVFVSVHKCLCVCVYVCLCHEGIFHDVSITRLHDLIETC